MLNVVLDTNVIVTALKSRRGASYQLIRLIGEAMFRVNISVALALEYEEVLKRAGLVPGLSAADIDQVLILRRSEEPSFSRTIKEISPGLPNEASTF
jgi:predicted nucleic acid-binding protein